MTSSKHELELSRLKELHSNLLETEFDFIARGDYLTREIHEFVRQKFPELCNDDLLCSAVCSNGNQSPEWRHKVRRVLQEFGKLRKNKGKIENVKRGVWRFQ